MGLTNIYLTKISKNRIKIKLRVNNPFRVNRKGFFI